MTVEETSRRATIRLLLRGVAPGPNGEVQLGDHVVFVTGGAEPEVWPQITLQGNEVAAVTWAGAGEAEEVTRALKKSAFVLALSAEGEV